MASAMGCFKFATYERDAGTGWDNAQARMYASNTARFLSPAPAALVAANPANPPDMEPLQLRIECTDKVR